MDKKLETIRAALANYIYSEGCTCCQNIEEHKKALVVLAGLLEIPMYDDGSGYDVYRFKTIGGVE